MVDRDNSSPAPQPDVEAAPSASQLSTVRRQMVEFDDLPREVREALASSDQPSDQMIDVLCAMHRGGFPPDAMMKVIAVSNARGGRDAGQG